MNVLADHGAFNNTAQPTKFPAGFFHIFTGSYDYPSAYCTVKGVYTNKAPGGVAYACSFRITEAAYAVERIVDCLAFELDMDPAELRMKNLLRAEQFPYTIAYRLGVRLGRLPAHPADGDGDRRLRRATPRAGREARAWRADGHRPQLLHRGVGAGPRKHMDILGLGMADGAELRVHPTGKAGGTDLGPVARSRTRDDVCPDRLRDHRDPVRRHRRGPWGHRQHPVRVGHLRQPFDAGVRALRLRSPRSVSSDKAKIIAAAMMEVSPDDIEVDKGTFSVKGDPTDVQRRSRRSRSQRTAQWSCLRASRGSWTRPACTTRRTSPIRTGPTSASLTWIAITGAVKVRRFIAGRRLRHPNQPDDRGRARSMAVLPTALAWR